MISKIIVKHDGIHLMPTASFLENEGNFLSTPADIANYFNNHFIGRKYII